jgi:hypothetical protein
MLVYTMSIQCEIFPYYTDEFNMLNLFLLNFLTVSLAEIAADVISTILDDVIDLVWQANVSKFKNHV